MGREALLKIVRKQKLSLLKRVIRNPNMNVTKHSEPKCEISLHEFELCSYQNLIGHSP